ncbi:hypothetical protein [Paenibacillus mendelii]|uniref:MBG domain-containing protein n=1 Tax=Paenibacillus mendelii TaxID=206163 RepID=A0ABV6J598_9BACL|nr:hypothetical protein [Paenibacillus mendelii]MCQ6560258.1 hypothetical protein [Paenibacillus mendelii]
MTSALRPDVTAATPAYTAANNIVNSFTGSIDASTWPVGNHTLTIRGTTKTGATYTVGIITVVIANPAASTSYLNTMDFPFSTPPTGNQTVTGTIMCTYGSTAPINAQGWSVHGLGVTRYDWNLDNGSWGALTGALRPDVTAATPAYNGANNLVNSFTGSINPSTWPIGTHSLVIRGTTKTGSTYTVGIITINIIN